MTLVFNITQEISRRIFGANLVILGEIYDKLLLRKASPSMDVLSQICGFQPKYMTRYRADKPNFLEF